MTKTRKNKLNLPRTEAEKENVKIQEFLDMCSPTAMRFYPDYYICGSSYRSVWAIQNYPTETKEQALLQHLGEKSGVTLKIYSRHVTPTEERKIISNATSKNRLNQANSDVQQHVIAESNIQNIVELVAQMHRNREPLLHCAVYVELSASSVEELKEVQYDVMAELTRSKLSVDRLLLRQKEGFACTQPCGKNVFAEQFERVLPASSVANLYPFHYSGKVDPKGFYLGHDKYGSNVFVDFQRRTADKTNGNVLILGNSGQGKSYLMKLILTNFRESGMSLMVLDPEEESRGLTENLGGCYIDMLSGEFIINVLEPKIWDDGDKQNSVLSQHISFLRDFFCSYKDFSEEEIDTLEIMLQRLYADWNLTDQTNFNTLQPTDYPILSDLYVVLEKHFSETDETDTNVYTKEILRKICLGLDSMCVGAESKFFNGHTNITSDEFICFGVKGLLNASKNIKNAMLFNILSYMSNALLSKGNTVAAVDEIYLFLSNLTAVEYIRNFMKRVRKKDSVVVIASQNIEDFNQPNIKELTKPLFAIPAHQFLFFPGQISAKEYMDMLQMEENLYELVKNSPRGVCVFRHGAEVYHLVVKAQKYKEVLFGTAGGR
ncbi:MAG: ATP-binding protein [Bacillota bacterium]